MLNSGYIKSVFNSRPLLILGLSMLVAGLPLSLFLTSLSQFVLAGSFFLEGEDVKKKFFRFFTSEVAILLVAIWLIHVIGLLWTSNYAEGIKDIRIKLPLLTLPVILSGGGKIESVQFRFIISVFLVAVLTGTLISCAVLIGIIPIKIDDIRDIFIFHISHIRFALFLCFAIVTATWLMSEASGWKKFFLYLLIFWFIIFLFIMQSMTGVAILVFLIFIFSIYFSIKQSKYSIRILLATAFIILTSWIVNMSLKAYRSAAAINTESVDYTETTLEGHAYVSDTTLKVYENGHRVWVYVCDEELEREWAKRSTVPFNGKNQLLQPLRTSLIRFMSSKGLRKDAAHLKMLSDEEVQAVERGFPNVTYLHITGFERRIKEIAWEYVQYRKGLDPNDHSITQRLEFWKAASSIIHDHPWLGTGTGDMPQAYSVAYQTMQSPLRTENRLRAHNQFLSIGVAFGVPAMILFILAMFRMLYSGRKNKLFIATWIILMISMLTEDTLETQSGVTFFAFGLMFWIYTAVENNKSTDQSLSN